MTDRWQGRAPCFFAFMALLAFHPGLAGAAGVWTEAVLPPAAPLNAVAYSGRAVAWAAGDMGVMFRWHSGAWEVFPSGTDRSLRAIATVANGEAWAVGDGGAIVHYNGSAWNPDPQSQLLTLLDLKAVAFLNEDNGWAAGGTGASGGVIIHYDGSSWSVVQTLTRTVNGIAVVASDYAWFCGDAGSLVHFDGSTFTQYTVGTGDWNAVTFPYRRLGWVVGEDGAIARFSPSVYAAPGWGLVTSPTTSDLKGVRVLPDPEWGYAVGAGGIRIRYDGSWLYETSGGDDLSGIDLPNRLEGSAAGGGAAARIVMVRSETTALDLAQVRVYPNPFNPLKGGALTMDLLPAATSRIEIATLRGEVVAEIGEGVEFDPTTGVATWRGVTRAGKSVAMGPYLFRVSAPGVPDRRGRILVVK